MAIRLQITKGNTFLYRPTTGSVTLEFGCEVVENNIYRDLTPEEILSWSISPSTTGVSIASSGILTATSDVADNTSLEVIAELNGMIAKCPLRIFDEPEIGDVVSDLDAQILSLRAATQISMKPLILNDELSVDEMLSLVAIFPDYEVGQAYKIGDIFTYGGKLYEVIQAHTSQEDWKPDEVPALYKNKTPDNVIAEWVQPTGSHDAYQIGDKVMYNGQIWICISGDSEGNNVWKPDVFGWEVYEEIPPDVIPDWVQPLGSFDAYQIDDIVTHNEQLWICIVPNNTWEPGVYGWEVYNE